MANEKTFKYKIVTQVDGSAIKNLEIALKSITLSINSVSDNFKKLGNTVDGTIKNSKSQIDSLVSSLKGVVTVFGAISLAKSVMEGIFDFGKTVIEAAKFKQIMSSTIDVFYPGRSGSIISNSIDIGNKTPSDTKPLLTRVQSLLSSGLSERQLGKAESYLADIEANGGGTDVLDSAVLAMKAIAGGGAPEIGSSIIEKYLGKSNYIRYQAKAAGVKNWETGNLDDLNKKVNDARKTGKLTAIASLQGFEEAGLKKTKTTSIGDFAINQAKGSIAGAISNFSSILDNMLLSTDLDKIPGIKALVKLLNSISTTLQTPEFQGGLAEIINSIFAPIETLANNPTKIKALLTTVKNAFVEIGSILGKVLDFFTQLFLAKSMESALIKVVQGLKDVLTYIGTIIGEAIWQGISGKKTSEQIEREQGEKELKEETDRKNKHIVEKIGGVELSETDSDNLKNRFGLTKESVDQPITIINNINAPGGDPKEVAKATESGTTDALQKSSQKSNLRKAGRSN